MGEFLAELEALANVWSQGDMPEDGPALYLETQAPQGVELECLPISRNDWVPHRLMTIALAKASAKALEQIDTIRRTHQTEIDDLRAQIGRLEALLDVDVQ